MDQGRRRTDPRVVRTRQLLKDSLIDLLQEMDIEKISVNQLTERATISRVTFYLHYRDIPNMLEVLADEMVEDIKRAVNYVPEKSIPTEEMEWLLMARLLEHIETNARFYKVVLGSRKIPIFTERLLNMLSKMVTLSMMNEDKETYIATPVIQKKIAIWYGTSALIGTIVNWLQNDMPYTPQFLAQQFSSLHNMLKGSVDLNE